MPLLVRRLLTLLAVLAIVAGGVRFIATSERDRANGRTDDVAPISASQPLVVPSAPAEPVAPQPDPSTTSSSSASPSLRSGTTADRARRTPSTTPASDSSSAGTKRQARTPLRGIDPAWLARTSAATDIPQVALTAYVHAADDSRRRTPGCRLSWNTLAGLAAVESDHGRHGGATLDGNGTARPAIIGPALDGKEFARVQDTDAGRLDGDAELDRAVGPLQFIPATWRLFASDGNGDGRADAQNIADASVAAARYLCDGGRDLTRGPDWWAAISSYNHSTEYVHAVLTQANRYARQSAAPASTTTTSTPPRALSLPQGAYPLPGLAVLPVTRDRRFGTAGAVVAAALGQQGVPYAWGGGGPSGPGRGFAQGAGTVGFDCSSLMQFAFAQGAGLALPRVSQQQKDVGRPVAEASIRPGDLIVFSGHGWGHVGLYIGNGLMVHAPFTGARVRVQALDAYRTQDWRIRRLI